MDPLPLLRDLVAANSVNPSLSPGGPGEAAAAEVARAALGRAGIDAVVREVAPGRPNVVGIVEGRTPGPTFMVCGHLDTVGVEGMTDPFTPTERDGRLYGRGAQDMKGGVAAMIAAAAVLAPTWQRGRLVVACVADEEHMSLGAEALVREFRADAAVVTEPTDLRLAIGHKGFAWVDVVTHGRAAHGSRPLEGRDAIVHMGRVLTRLDGRDRELRMQPPTALLGTASLHASIISGGREPSVYPDRCDLQYERRVLAGEDRAMVDAEIATILAELHAADPDFSAEARVTAYRPAYLLDPSHVLPTVVGSAIAKTGGDPTPIGMSFWTDAAVLAEAGIPAALFGPGGAGLHGVEEYVTIADVLVCRDVLVHTARMIAAG